MQYVYGCSNDKSHPRQEVSHGMTEIIRLTCQECGAEMRRIPQPFRWGFAAHLVLIEHLEEKYRKNTYRRSLNK